MTNAFEYGDALLPQDQGAPEDQDAASHNIPYLNLPTFVVMVLKS
jgi:hypothetical protein